MDQQFVSVHIKLALISQLEESPRYLLFHVWWALHVFSSGLSISQQFILYSPMLLYVFPNKKKKKKPLLWYDDMLRWILYKRSPYTFIKNRSPYIVGFSWKLCSSSYLLHLTFLPLVFYQIKKLTKALTALI